MAGTPQSPSNSGLLCTTSAIGSSPMITSYTLGVSERCSMPSAVEALPWGSRSMTSTRAPDWASAAARLTAVVVLPTPPFWLVDREDAGLGRQR